MKRLGLLICALAIGLGAPDSADAGRRRDQGPPPWAPAHGYRDKHERRQHNPQYHHKPHHYHHQFRHRDDRREVRWRVPAHRWKFHEEESAIIAGLIGGAIGSLLTGPGAAAVLPQHAPVGPWAPPLHASPAAPSFSSLGGHDPSFSRYCREFSRDALISGRPQEIYGVACWQPDGSWEVVSVDRR